jgi:hypothetical protein
MRPETKFLARFAVVAVSLSIALDALHAPLATPVAPVQQNLMQADAKGVARELLTDKQFRCFTQLIGKESAWNEKAQNPTSTAAGVGQLLKGTYRNLGMRHSKEAVPQMVAALAYIGRRYGSAGPCGAWRHWQKKNWY